MLSDHNPIPGSERASVGGRTEMALMDNGHLSSLYWYQQPCSAFFSGLTDIISRLRRRTHILIRHPLRQLRPLHPLRTRILHLLHLLHLRILPQPRR